MPLLNFTTVVLQALLTGVFNFMLLHIFICVFNLNLFFHFFPFQKCSPILLFRRILFPSVEVGFLLGFLSYFAFCQHCVHSKDIVHHMTYLLVSHIYFFTFHVKYVWYSREICMIYIMSLLCLLFGCPVYTISLLCFSISFLRVYNMLISL